MENNKPTTRVCACGCGLEIPVGSHGRRRFVSKAHQDRAQRKKPHTIAKRKAYHQSDRYLEYEAGRAEAHRVSNRLRKRRILAHRKRYGFYGFERRKIYAAIKEEYARDLAYWRNLEWSASDFPGLNLEARRKYAREKAKLPKNRIKNTLRLRIRKTLRGQIKYGRTMELTGCTRDFLIKWIERQFARGMTWDNYGKEWVVDHIQPCAGFDLSRESEQRKCFHYTNLRPLCKVQNMQKSDSIIPCQPEFPMQISISPFSPGKQTAVVITHK